jgi:hypothetical protein
VQSALEYIKPSAPSPKIVQNQKNDKKIENLPAPG